MDVDIISNYMDENMLDISLPVKKIKKKSIQGSKQRKNCVMWWVRINVLMT